MVFKEKPPLVVTIGTALLLIGAGALTYFGLRWRLARIQGLPLGARAVPQVAIAAVTLSTDTEQWRQLRQFGTPETQTTFDQQLADWRDRWFVPYGISFTEDIEPWVGPEVTVAWVSGSETATEDGSNPVELGGQQRMLLLPIEDPEEAQIYADSLPIASESAEQIEYRGVVLQQFLPTTGDDNEAVLVGLLGTQLILVAEDELVAQKAIDAYKGGKNLADLAGYRRSFEHIGTSQAFGKLYLNIPAAVELLAQSSQPALPSTLIESFQDSRGLAATVTLESQGLQIRSTSWLGADSDLAYVDTNIPSQLPQYLPRETLVLASGGNFQQFWQDLGDRRNWGAFTALDPDNLALALQGSTGLTLENDLLPWMGGEFALALVPPPVPESQDDEEIDLPTPGLATLVQVSDRLQAEQAFAKLDEVIENRYRFTISDEPAGDIELSKWTSPFESLTLTRGWLESSIAFLTVGDGTEDALIPKPRRSLAKAPLFQLTTGDAPYPNSGYFYINLEAINQADENLFLPALSVENQGVLKAIQALGVTATVLDEQRLRYDLYLALKRGNRPGPLPSTESTESSEETVSDEAAPLESAPEESPSDQETSETGETSPETSPDTSPSDSGE
ncbi:DUF3352 domain-containing protein [Oscillatoria sp. CS-180]|uniref:DUF3352 domain-containing protein n=1 Tax=Oscillatoria sp. CS-180 TaxID=3021720 RepID=UPI00232FE949|nr:DUF3352 domain-containing protein [Oscillatoria sp. CS-180]MDB9525760.1 DUF3352 domain-containing protein [Oscillatoria sp. CS-180]